MKMITWNKCDCDRCVRGKNGEWINDQWTCYFTGKEYRLIKRNENE